MILLSFHTKIGESRGTPGKDFQLRVHPFPKTVLPDQNSQHSSQSWAGWQKGRVILPSLEWCCGQPRGSSPLESRGFRQSIEEMHRRSHFHWIHRLLWMLFRCFCFSWWEQTPRNTTLELSLNMTNTFLRNKRFSTLVCTWANFLRHPDLLLSTKGSTLSLGVCCLALRSYIGKYSLWYLILRHTK